MSPTEAAGRQPCSPHTEDAGPGAQETRAQSQEDAAHPTVQGPTFLPSSPQALSSGLTARLQTNLKTQTPEAAA